MRRTLAALLVLTFLSPAASAWPWDPITVTVADSHAGDRYRFAVESVRFAGDREERAQSTILVEVEAPATIPDKHGIARAAQPHLVQAIAGDGSVESTQRCFALAGGVGTVRVDPLGWRSSAQGAWTHGAMGLSLGSSSVQVDSTLRETYSGWPCEGRNLLAGRAFTQGERARLGDFFPWEDVGLDVLSAPAEETTFHGRQALAFPFDLAKVFGEESPVRLEGVLRVTIADGLPGMARYEVRGTQHENGEPTRGGFSRELAGIVVGSGPAPARMDGAEIPAANPNARIAPYAPGSVPDEAFGLAYPFADARAAIVGDATLREFQAWRAQHPGAILASASYSREARALAGESDGAWRLTFVDGAEAWIVQSTRARLASPLGPLGSAATRVENEAQPSVLAGLPIRTLPPALADSASLAAIAAAHGVAGDALKTLEFGLRADLDGAATPYLLVGTTGSAMDGEGVSEGIQLSIDPAAASLLSVESQRKVEQHALLGELPSGGVGAQPSALAALAGPGVGVGLGVGAATGLAILVVLAKLLLLPLFTRLRRDRLLDNPVRARLYERVRAEPGIHRAELVDALGIGEGATQHHLDQLVRHRLIVEVRDEGFVRYCAAGEVPPDVARRAALLRGASARAVYDLFSREPDLSLRQAALRLGMSAPSVHRAKKKLVKVGLLPALPTHESPVAQSQS